MEIYHQIIALIDSNLIFCLIPITLTFMVIELLFKNRFETKRALNVIRWIIIFYTIFTIGFYIFSILFKHENYDSIHPSNVRISMAYGIMYFTTFILPFSLFIKKLGNNFWYVLFISFGLKIGNYIELFLILYTNFLRNTNPSFYSNDTTHLIWNKIGFTSLQGIIIAIAILGILTFSKKIKLSHNS